MIIYLKTCNYLRKIKFKSFTWERARKCNKDKKNSYKNCGMSSNLKWVKIGLYQIDANSSQKN